MHNVKNNWELINLLLYKKQFKVYLNNNDSKGYDNFFKLITIVIRLDLRICMTHGIYTCRVSFHNHQWRAEIWTISLIVFPKKLKLKALY